ncbi:hypothetical protein E5361_06435 [Histophilus somni]|uniref:Bacteriophage Mx8 p63 C-terminal domain-containing protein n=1 Tax=Histophilus somni (strain 129Pt) TaxID=205914 RepID=Q0I4I6_HISS1|nr:P63C domain-containing protein [Histophilus somni]THA21345.1 hypothetical protein E5361_06435 [Histophilus somni]
MTTNKLTPEMRKARAEKAAQTRWENKKLLDDLSLAIHEGVLTIGDVLLDVAVLEDDKRMISTASVFQALDRPVRGSRGASITENEKVISLPAFMDANNLKPFINQDVIEVIKRVKFKTKDGQIKEGYDATILPMVCDVYLKAREENVLTKAQQDTAKKAEILVRSLAKVGIVALVDEATGYQDARAKDALAKIFEAFVAKELQPWVKTFPLDYYKELCRLYGVQFPPKTGTQFPQFFGHITNNAIYERLAPELLPELKKMASKQARKAKLHQFLSEDIGHPKLREHLSSVITILKLSKDKENFYEMLDRIHPKLTLINE